MSHWAEALLGAAFQSPALQLAIHKWPQLEWIDDEDLQGAVRDHRLSLMNQELGLYLFFTDDQTYRDRYGPPKSAGSLILSRAVYLLGLLPAYTVYAGPLPMALASTDDFAALRAKAGAPSQVWRAGDRVCKARWEHEALVMDVSLATSGTGLKVVSLTPQRSQQSRRREAVRAQACGMLPDPAEFLSLLGTPLSILATLAPLAPLDLASHQKEIAEYGEADFTRAWGLELYFKPGRDIDRSVHPGPGSSEPCLSGMRYRADLDFSSPGFKGPLPYGLAFDDPPAMVTTKLGGPPFWSSFDERDGAERWRFERADVHVLYSVLEDRIYRVTLLARGCYDN
jgi:hypothetical protein